MTSEMNVTGNELNKDQHQLKCSIRKAKETSSYLYSKVKKCAASVIFAYK